LDDVASLHAKDLEFSRKRLEDLVKLASIACSILAGIPSPALAVCGTVNCPDVVVQRLYPTTDGKTYVKIDASLTPLN